jgi:PAS domain-containing protein
VRDGKEPTRCAASRNSKNSIALLTDIEAENPTGDISMITDHLSSHNSLETRTWLEAHPRLHHVFIPTGACWLNLQEGWWRLLRRDAAFRAKLCQPRRNRASHSRCHGSTQPSSQAVDLGTPPQVPSPSSPSLLLPNVRIAALQRCTQSLVDHLDAAFARIWTLNTVTQELELQASAGMYTHFDGAHSRVPVGSLKIGVIAAERLPHLTNAVIGDPRVSEQEWAKREGMVVFAGYPLVIAEKLVGVMALFARKTLTPTILDAMASVANIIALGIDHKRVEDERNHLLLVEQQARAASEAARQRLTSIVDNLMDGFMLFDTQYRYTYINPQAGPLTGKPREGLLGKNVWEEFPALVRSSFY